MYGTENLITIGFQELSFISLKLMSYQAKYTVLTY